MHRKWNVCGVTCMGRAEKTVCIKAGSFTLVTLHATRL
jgi:hypothetical protein